MSQHYVYAHLDNGFPVYVGVGEGGRAWMTNATTRKPDHKEWMLSQLPENLTIQFLATGVTKEEAHSLERQIIFELKPKFNKTVPVYKCKWKAPASARKKNWKYR